MKYNLRENKQLVTRLLTEALVKSKADEYPNWKPTKKWTGTFAKYETLLVAIGARPYPYPYGGKAIYEVAVGDDIIDFHYDGTAYSTNESISYAYGVDPKYKGITLYDKSDKKDIKGAIELKNGKPTWTPVAVEDKAETEESWVDYLQLGLDIVGVVPGFGDIADIINAGISFGRGNYLEGFLSLIGAIPGVGSLISLPIKLVLKGMNRAGDVLKAAWRGNRSADEVWMYIQKSGKLDRAQLDMLSKGMGDVSDYITKFRKDADFALPANASKALNKFAEFLKKNGDSAEKLFATAGKNADKANKRLSILKVRKELDQLGGIERLLGKGIGRRLKNTFSTALSKNELEALRGAMDIKFYKNMDNPGKLATLASMDPKLSKTILTNFNKNANNWFKTLPTNTQKIIAAELSSIKKAYAGNPAKMLEQQLAFVRNNNLSLYKTVHKDIVELAAKNNNPLYKSFMNSEINGLGSYFSKDYIEIAGLKAAKERWSNLAPIVYNELSDMGEDALMAAGIETKDDVNGLFYPMLKSTLNAAEYIPFAGNAVTWAKTNIAGPAGAAAKMAADAPVLGNLITKAADIAGANAGKPYDPNTKFTIVPDEDPRLKQQAKEKEKRIQQKKSWF
jgi:hypothetical protein